ncbi:hypothetical protein JCM19047_1006 [Bacillus sp. JCM 19047]|nr:hypothetical protein JCM19047_1006 [Bacillus sp. JCM 19047]
MSNDSHNYEEEPPLSDFLEDEPKKEKKGRRRFFRIIALVVALALFVQTVSFLFEHYSINAWHYIRESESLFNDEAIEAWQSSVVVVETNTGHGTGFFVSEEGDVLTNHHVSDEQGPLWIVTADGKRYEAESIKHDIEKDLALLRVDAENQLFQPLKLAEPTSFLHENVIVIGHPQTHSFIANEGEVSEEVGDYQRLSITNDVYPGHSGSPVLSQEGEVIGIIYARSLEERTRGEGLAVPIQQVQAFLYH